jgi:ribosome small subunit-dependent GTPase A
MWQAAPQGQGDEGTIEKVLERRNLFYRQDELRTKSFAANIDQVLILIAAEPVFSESQLARALITAEATHITPLIALNKSDLVEPFARAWERLQPYRHMGKEGQHYGVLPLCLTQSNEVDREVLLQHLRGKVTLVLGPSGSGKSTLINLLVPRRHCTDGRNLAGPELRQAHHHQHPLVLGGRRAHHGTDRLPRLSRIWPAPHRPYAAGQLHARYCRPCQ